MTEYIIKPNDLPTLLESMGELSKEIGEDKITPSILAKRMTSKGGLTYQFHQVSYMLRLVGFETRYSTHRESFIIPDPELIKRLQKELPQIAERTKAQVIADSPYRSRVNFGNWNYFRSDWR